MRGSAPLLQVDHVSKSYGGIEVLHDVSFELGPGEVVALAGENGAGKSTVLSIITGLVQPTSGRLSFEGLPVPEGWSPARARLSGLSSVQQELSVNPHQSIAENIFMGRWPARAGMIRASDLERRSLPLLERVGLALDPRTPVRRLPLGDRQLVEIAKALVHEPRLLILDEATSALDDTQVALVFDLVRDLKAHGTTTVLVTHRIGEMFQVGDRFLILKDGALVDTRERAATTEDDLVQAMLGRTMSQLFPDRSTGTSTRQGRTGLSVRGLTTGPQVRDVDLDVAAGRIVGLGGLQGQGQRDVLRALFGLEAYRGQVQTGGADVSLTSPQAAISHHIAYVPEDRKVEGVLLEHTVSRNLELPNLRSLAPWSRLTTVSGAASRRLVEEMISALQIKATPRQTARRLSGGNQQKVALAKWLPTHPHVLLLSEPTRGIDIGTKREIYRLLRGFADDGMSILLTSGDTLELIGLCDEVVVMYEGRTVTSLTGDELTEERLVQASVVGAHRDEGEVA